MKRLVDGRTSLDLREGVIKDAKLLNFVFRLKPELAREILPPPLTPDPACLGSLYLADFGKNNFGAQPYHEAGLFVRAQFDGRPGYYCVAMILDDDVAMIGGREFFGYPKKLGTVSLVREGNLVRGSVSRRESAFLNVTAELADETSYNIEHATFGPCVYNFKYFLNAEQTGFEFPPKLIRQEIREDIRKMESGSGVITLGKSKLDPWYELEPGEIISVTWKEGDLVLPASSTVAHADPQAFLPYAFARYR